MSGIENNTWQKLISSPQKMAVKKEPAKAEPEKKQVKPELKSKKVSAKALEQPKEDSFKNHNDDPLSKYPLRGLAYTNEVGVAIAEVLPTLGLALWVPALMYFGADIYNKYAQGREGDYSKASGRKGLERATFQALASVALPTFAVLGGKELTSKGIQKWGESKLSPSAQKEILSAIEKKIGEGAFKDTTKRGGKSALETVKEPILKLIDLRKSDKKSTKNFSGVNFKKTPKMDKTKVEAFIEKHIEEILDLKKHLRGETVEGRKFNKKYAKFYEKQKEKFANDIVNDSVTAERKAVRKTMQKYVKNKMVKPKTIKTIGGFVALICLALPIDYLVEEVILKKGVEPGLDYVEEQMASETGFLGIKRKKA